jgi:hypothetical protein
MVYRKGDAPVETLLDELCVKYGFCLKPIEHAEMLEVSTADLDAWTNALFIKEGLGEHPDKKLWRQIRQYAEARLNARG